MESIDFLHFGCQLPKLKWHELEGSFQFLITTATGDIFPPSSRDCSKQLLEKLNTTKAVAK